MQAYWLIWALAAVGVIARPVAPTWMRQAAWLAYGAILVLFVGLRRDVGGDWGVYADYVNRAVGISLLDGLAIDDVGYAALNWVGANGFAGIYFVNFTVAVIAVSGLMIFCSRQENAALALLIAVPYLLVVVFLGYGRQSAAIGFGLLALLAASNGREWRFLVFVTLAALFHKSALVFFLFAPALYAGQLGARQYAKLGLMGLYALLLIYLLVFPRLGWFWNSYMTISAGSASSPEDGVVYSRGAQMRLGISVLAAAVFAAVARRRMLPERSVWIWSIASLSVIVLFGVALFKSTFADRLGLYFIPLQLVAFSLLPLLVAVSLRRLVECGVVIATAATLGVWLFLADHAPSWLPYDNLLFGPWPMGLS